MLGYISDNVKEDILKKYSQEEIFGLVFDTVNESKYISPFREDNHAGCFFLYDKNGILRFKDKATNKVINNINISNLDCFNAVQLYYNLNSFQDTLIFIKENINKVQNHKKYPKITRLKSKNFVQIFINIRDYTIHDKIFWYDRYEITRKQLLSDQVYAIKSYIYRENEFIPYKLTYAIIVNGTIKIYSPYKKKNQKGKFITNSSNNDIGGDIKGTNKKLIITKSYKDYRVLKNNINDVDIIFFQSENMFPNDFPFLNNIEQVLVIFDNDKAGIENSELLVKKIKNEFSNIVVDKITVKKLPKVTDPSDLIYRNKVEFKKFIENVKHRL